MANKYSAWIYASVLLALSIGGITITNTTEWTAKRVLIKGCDYWEGKGQEHWCQEPLINQLEIKKCDKQLYYIYTHNNPCSDLIVTGGGGQRYYTKFSRTWASPNLDNCDVPQYIRDGWGICK
jgi:hypothetical protein